MSLERPVVITGAAGFVGRNLTVRLGEAGRQVFAVTRDTPAEEARAALASADIVVHLAGANRPPDRAEFTAINRDYAAWVAAAIAAGGRVPLVIHASSAQAGEDSDYGRSKADGEQAMLRLAESGAATVTIYRLPNVFGKWARPNYNSAVATFCHNVARGLPIEVRDPQAPLSLIYIDDLIDQWLALMALPPAASGMVAPECVYRTTVGAVADAIRGFAADRGEGRVAPVGTGLTRALYSTFVAALPQEGFSYPLVAHVDPRGSFSEMLKTRDSGQFSYFTAHPGVTRGGHYHHSKVEKFLVVQGSARFRFRDILSGETHEIRTEGATPVVVETIPGWTHDITNVGEEVLVSLLWANEIFDRERPDTVAMPL